MSDLAARSNFRVIKLGGSLLDWPGWPEALRRWRQAQPPRRDLLIAGGGAWADLVREADGRFALGQEASHGLCLRLMSVTARLVHRLLPEASFLDAWPCSAALPAGSLAVLDCLPLIERFERAEESSLPHSWEVTSDSIAAWLATRLGASELALLKSQLPPPDACLLAASQQGYVDRYFPVAAGPLPLIRCVNLRDAGLHEAMLRV